MSAYRRKWSEAEWFLAHLYGLPVLRPSGPSFQMNRNYTLTQAVRLGAGCAGGRRLSPSDSASLAHVDGLSGLATNLTNRLTVISHSANLTDEQ
jgi:hypothetical protein